MKRPHIYFHIDVNSAFLSWSSLLHSGEEGYPEDIQKIPAAIGVNRSGEECGGEAIRCMYRGVSGKSEGKVSGTSGISAGLRSVRPVQPKDDAAPCGVFSLCGAVQSR